MNKETQLVEWKQIWKDDYLGWLAGYANANGGTLIIGKNDSGNVIGIDNAPKLLVDLPNKIRDVLGIIVDVNLKTENTLEYIEITVPVYSHGISYKGEYHYRSGSTKQILKGASLNKFLLDKSGLQWEAIEVSAISFPELDLKAFDFFRKGASQTTRLSESELVVSNEILLEKLNLISNKSLTRAAILLFHNNPEKFISGAYIKIGFFNEHLEVAFHDEIHGSLFYQIEETIEILTKKYLRTNLRFGDIKRTEELDYPVRALREAIINAIAHKDYSLHNPVQIKVFENKIQIFNEGTLPNNWTIEQFLGNHPSRPANPMIANVLFRAGYIEAWGTGISVIIRECNIRGLPLPQFNFDFGGLMVEIQQNNLNAKVLSSGLYKALELLLSQGSNPSITDRNISEFAPIAKRLEDKSLSLIIAFPEGDPLRRKDVMTLIDLTNQTYNTERYLTPLIKEGLISQIIKSRPNSSNQRYILTEKGSKFKYVLRSITKNES